MKRVKKRGAKRRFPLELFLIVFLISFILLAFVFFIFSIVGTSDFWQIISGQKKGADVEKFGKEIGIVKPRWISYMLISIVVMLVLVVAGLMYRYIKGKD